MKVSEQWLREWVNPAATMEELAEQLTMAGLEVDSITDAAPAFDGIVVGRVLKVEAHPNADKLRICEVDTGQEAPLRIVCGASNVRESLHIPVAMIGATLPGNFRIKKSKLRGEESHGMLCSATELGLAESSDGLLELPADAPVGCDIREYLSLDDRITEIDLTPNRGDCLSIAGIARELGVLNRCDVQGPVMEPVTAQIDDQLSIQVEAADDCPRYLGRVIRGVDPEATTPLWMQERLRRGGIRSLGPLVDVTNYILLELGHPMHAFNLSAVADGIIVRRARKGESLQMLDGKSVDLTAETLVIADRNRPLAMAGIMGGEAASVDDDTRDIFLECAYFAPEAIAGRARSFGMQTDSAHRFERGVDPAGLERAMQRATRLLLEIAGGEAGPVIEVSSALNQCQPILLRASRIKRLLGMEIPAAEVEEIMRRLGMVVEASGADWRITAPSFRFDISIEADLIEEIGRIHGYNRLPSTEPRGALIMRPCPEGRVDLRQLHQLLIHRGYQEAITYSFVDPQEQALLEPESEAIALANPISSEMAVMRTSLWPGLLQAVKYNLNRQHNRIRMFESGLKFIKQHNEIKQINSIAGIVYGETLPEQWGEKGRKADFFDLKADVEELLRFSGKSCSFVPSTHPALHPGQSADVLLDQIRIGALGALHPNISSKQGVTGSIYLFELEVESLVEARVPTFEAMSKYPSVRRDFAVVVDQHVHAEDIIACIRLTIPDLLQEIRVFDVYSGQGVDQGRKSLALGLILQESSRTLNEKDMDSATERVMSQLQKEFSATLRE